MSFSILRYIYGNVNVKTNKKNFKNYIQYQYINVNCFMFKNAAYENKMEK